MGGGDFAEGAADFGRAVQHEPTAHAGRVAQTDMGLVSRHTWTYYDSRQSQRGHRDDCCRALWMDALRDGFSSAEV